MGLAKLLGKAVAEIVTLPVTLPAEVIKEGEKLVDEAFVEEEKKK